MRELTIVIADDDRLVLEDIMDMVDWKALGFSVAATASSGEECLQKLERFKPDILMTDIQMKGMDGLDVIEKAALLYPDMKFIIITSYDLFDYAKRAISSGVTDYILKNELDPARLTRVLEKTRQAVIPHDRDSYWTGHRLDLYFQDRGPDSTPPEGMTGQLFLFTVICSAVYFSRKEDFSPRKEPPGLKETVWKELENHSTKPVLFSHSGHCIAGIAADTLKVSAASAQHSFGHEITYRLRDYNPPCMHFYLETPMTLDEFKSFYYKILPLIEYNRSFYPDSLYMDLSKLKKTEYMPVERKFPFHSLVFDEDQLENDIILIKGYLTECFTACDINSVRGFFNEFCTYLEIRTNGRLSPEDPVIAPTPEHLQKWIYNRLFECIKFLNEGLETTYSPAVDGAIRFMQQNYSDNNLTAADTAAFVGLSANRLGVIFKKETGKTVNEYLGEIRVEKAVELLKKTNMKIYEISEKCGYKSSQYFSQIVMQKTGRRPIDFRKGSK